jgi:hypothetical protein
MYDIDFKNLKKGKNFGAIFFGAGFFFFCMMIGMMYSIISESGGFELEIIFILIFFALPGGFMYIGYSHIKNVNKRIKIVKHLNQYGKLVKGIPYKLEYTGMSVNGRSVMKPVVNYQLPNGQLIRLEGDPRHDFKERDEDGLVDMLIDETNPEFYYIDLEINRYSGNRKEDYYKENGVVIEESVQSSELNQPFNNFYEPSSPENYKPPYDPL